MRAALTASFALLAGAMLATASPLGWSRSTFVPPAYDTWIWSDQGGNVCADGSQTGFAYNMHANANELLIYFDGGGACWDTQSCFVTPMAMNLQGYNNASFQANTRPSLENQLLLTSRDPARSNPWSAAHYVFVPYCTGDVHAGNNVVTYPGAPAPINHHGSVNFQNILSVVAGAVPSVSNVWVTGTSAGCYGATLNYNLAKKAWPWAKTHLIADSCATTPGYLNTRPSWKINQPSGKDCPKCQVGEFNTFLPGLSQANTGSRFGSLSFASDTVLPTFMGVTGDEFSTIITKYFANITSTPTNQAKDFLTPGSGHGVLYVPNPASGSGTTMQSWLASMKNLRSAYKSY